MTAASESPDRLIRQVDLDAVTVKLVNLAFTRWHLVSRRCQRRRDESGEERVHADRRGFLLGQ